MGFESLAGSQFEIGSDSEEHMDYSKVVIKEDVELETLKKFLNNQSVVFDKKLVDPSKTEPTDIRYDGINYQITEGDKKEVQTRRQITSKGTTYLTIRDTTNIAELLLRSSLKKKSTRSDSNTVLLIDVMSTGGRDWDTLGKELSAWASQNSNLCSCWKEIYLVYREKNVKLAF